MESERPGQQVTRPAGGDRPAKKPFRVVRVVVAIGVITLGMAVIFGLYYRPHTEPQLLPPAGRGYLASLPIQTVGGKVDFGDVKPCGSDFKRTAKIRNQSAEPVEILAYSPNCACLTAKLIGDRTLGPGEERDVELTIHPSGHGSRSTAVEFAYQAGFAGSLRVDFAFTRGVLAAPDVADVHEGDRDFAIDVEVFSGDRSAVTVTGVDPPIGSFEVMPAAFGKVALSSYEALEFANSPSGRVHPGVKFGADGKPEELVVTITTTHPDCPLARFTFNFLK
jgi:hypothetical protein